MHHADVVELVDTLDSGSSAREGMKVQVLSSALKNPVVLLPGFSFSRHPERSGFSPIQLLYSSRIDWIPQGFAHRNDDAVFFFTSIDFDERYGMR